MNEITIVYLTINKLNNKIYIGVHDTFKNVTDSYLGCGCYSDRPGSYVKKSEPFAKALVKYGPENFQRYTLAEFNTRKEALNLERILVDENFIKRKDTYNITIGGGDPPLHTKTIYQYDLNGKFLKEWNNMTSTEKQLNLGKDALLNAIKNKTNCMNSFWSYEKTDILNISEFRQTRRSYIQQYDLNLNFIAEYSSIKEASEKTKISENVIVNSLKRHSCSTGFYFIKCFEDINIVANQIFQDPLHFYVYDIKGNLYKEYYDVTMAIKDFEKAKRSSIKSAIFREKKYKDYYWSLDYYDNFLSRKYTKKVGQYDLQGNLIKIWNSVTECRKQFTNCARVINNAQQQTKGFTFKFIN